MKRLSLKVLPMVAGMAFYVCVMCGCMENNDMEATVGELTEALPDEAWNSSVWISAVDAPVVTGRVTDAENNRAADGASWFMTTVVNDKKVTRVKWMTTGLGVYELYVNGHLVGDEILKPGFTHYAKTRRSFTYDVTETVKCRKGAENTFAAQVTPGWWADKIVTWGGSEGMNGKKCAFRSVLEVVYSDGSTQLYGTNIKDWKAGIAGPVRHAAIFDGETYDAREPQGFETPEKLSEPEENHEFTGEILPTCGAEVYYLTDLILNPIQMYTWHETEGKTDDEYGKVIIDKEFQPSDEVTLQQGETLIVDFGQNCAAVPLFRFKAAKGTVLTCLPAELLNDGNGAKRRGMDGPEGSCHRTNLRTSDKNMRVDYTFGPSEKPSGKFSEEPAEKPSERRAEKFVTYHPSCTFFGYRYLSITATNEVHLKSIQSLPVSSISRNMETGTLETGNPLVNQLISNTLWGQRSNYLSVPTDCPQRNERLGWTADTQVFAETGSFFANTDAFFHKWMRDMRDTQSPLGGFPGVAPWGQYGSDERSMMRVGWADAGVIVPWTIWKQFGDTDMIHENWEAMERYMEHVSDTKYDHEALIAENGNYQWADWLSYEPLETCSGRAFIRENGRNFRKPEAIEYWNYLSASYWAIDAGMMCDMAAATGHDVAKYENMVSEAKQYLRERFLNDDGTFCLAILNDMQTPALFALKNGLVEGTAKDSLKARLRKNFADHDNCLQTGFLGTSILMNTLTENDMVDIAYELLFQRRNPSWLYSIDNGATTVWERWNSYMKEKGMGPKGMNSFNHYAYGCVCEWLWKTAAGISADPSEPGFKHIIMKPIPDKRLNYLKASYNSVSGLIESEWHCEGDTCHWTFTVPAGTTATVTLPGQSTSQNYTPGTYTLHIRE